MIHDFSKEKSILSQYILEIRSLDIQHDKQRFRNNIIRIGQLIAYEISKKLAYENIIIKTPLAEAVANRLATEPVIATILRAGLPLHQGVLSCFDNAENAFVSAFRQINSNKQLEYVIEYISSPRIQDKTLIITDPMLATGLSMVRCLEKMIEKKGTPKAIHIVGVIGSAQGVQTIAEAFPSAHIWVAAVDEILNKKQYIVPGLGDAGDLAYGSRE